MTQITSPAGLDDLDKRIVNALQGGFPVCELPFAVAGEKIGIGEEELIARICRLCDNGTLSRFGPMFNAERIGGGVLLAAMAVPEDRFDAVARQVNAHVEVAHNYRREHPLNMWFVLASETPERIDAVMAEIERETGLAVLPMPKIEEYFVGLRLEA